MIIGVYHKMQSLSDHVALVTGASSGIGEATVHLLAARGAIVFGADLKVPEVEGTAWANSIDAQQNLLKLDVREETDWESAVATVIGRHGRLDILVHAAGISAACPLSDTTFAEWRRVMATNLDGSFLAVRHGVRAMRSAGGAIVVVGSASGIRPPAGSAAYSTSKAAVSMLVRAAAKECRDCKYPIRINCVSPAGVKTPMWRDMPFFQDLVREQGSEDAAFSRLETGAGGRFAEAEEIARVVLFLVSDAADHVNGVDLPVDGGYIL